MLRWNPPRLEINLHGLNVTFSRTRFSRWCWYLNASLTLPSRVAGTTWFFLDLASGLDQIPLDLLGPSQSLVPALPSHRFHLAIPCVPAQVCSLEAWEADLVGGRPPARGSGKTVDELSSFCPIRGPLPHVITGFFQCVSLDQAVSHIQGGELGGLRGAGSLCWLCHPDRIILSIKRWLINYPLKAQVFEKHRLRG